MKFDLSGTTDASGNHTLSFRDVEPQDKLTGAHQGMQTLSASPCIRQGEKKKGWKKMNMMEQRLQGAIRKDREKIRMLEKDKERKEKVKPC